MDMDDTGRPSDDMAEERLDNEEVAAQLELEIEPEATPAAEETDTLK